MFLMYCSTRPTEPDLTASINVRPGPEKALVVLLFVLKVNCDGLLEGWELGCPEGCDDGSYDGCVDGCPVGQVGSLDGCVLGCIEGCTEGSPVGCIVG